MNKTERNPENAFFFEQNKKILRQSRRIFMVETAGLDKLLLRKILMLCSSLGGQKNFHSETKNNLRLVYSRKPLRL